MISLKWIGNTHPGADGGFLSPEAFVVLAELFGALEAKWSQASNRITVFKVARAYTRPNDLRVGLKDTADTSKEGLEAAEKDDHDQRHECSRKFAIFGKIADPLIGFAMMGRCTEETQGPPVGYGLDLLNSTE